MALTVAQIANLDAPATRPITIVRWKHSGIEELLSCSGPVSFNGELYAAGGVRVSGIQDGQSASLSLPATAARISEVQNGTWRNGTCLIYAIPGTPSDAGGYVTADGILLLDGLITASSFSGNDISVTVLQRNLDGNLSPRNTLSEVCTHILPPGTVLIWGTGSVTLGSRR